MTPDDTDPLLAAGAIVTALLAGGALAVPLAPRLRAAAMVLALALTPALLLAEIWESEQVEALRDDPAVAGGAAAIGLAAVAVLAVLVHRRPHWLPVALVAALPFRVPIVAGGTTSSLLVPLYAVIAAGVLAYAVPRLLGRGEAGAEAEPEPAGAWLRRLLGLAIVLYAVQAAYSSDFERALQQVVFFYVPFALMATLLARAVWSRELVLRCLGVLVGLAVIFVLIGFWEYATRTLLLNPKVIASNQFETYFRVNSLFFDPNIYGRFLAIVMLLVTAALLWARSSRVVVGCGLLLALLWGGLVLTLSQSSFAALLGGLVVLAALRSGTRPAAIGVGAAALVAAVVAFAAPEQVGLGSDANTSGRVALVEGGVGLFTDAPVAGHGSGAFRREYRAKENASGERATNASHTQPVTVAAEQGVLGLAVYLALVVAALLGVLRGARDAVARAGVAAAFVALTVHTLSYAAFLEDPLAWALLAAGVGLRSLAPADP